MDSARSGIISLLTDFSLRDWYVGTVKGVLLRCAPAAVLVDITHDIEPGDVKAAAFAWRNSIPYFPPGTVHLAVVDPGVGGERAVLAVESESGILVAPDNGLVSWILAAGADWRAWRITSSEFCRSEPSATFHGRDVFAPLAAALAAGAAPAELGEPLADPVLIPWPAPEVSGPGDWMVPVLYVDRFGNLITSLPGEELGSCRQLQVAGLSLPRLECYEQAPAGELLGLIGSGGYLEISVNGGSAAETLGARPGDLLAVRALER